MESIRKWFYRPKKDDTSLLAQFFFADESLNAVACELDSFDGRQEPERCSSLVNQLRHCQDKVLTICNQIMDELIPDGRANRDFRVKFPDDVMQENLAGQLWFGAECLAAGSSIMNREAESSAMRPLAKALTKSLEIVRNLLRDHALKGHMNLKIQNPLEPSLEKLIESLKIFDRLFADFELCYVGAMVPVKSTKEYEQQELVCVLFSETLQRALEAGLLSQADVDNYEPALMFTIPRLAIVSGLLAPPGGPLCLNSTDSISEMFRPFRTLLLKIRELLWTLNNRELHMLEKLLCSNEEPSVPATQSRNRTGCQEMPDLEEFVHNFYTGYPNCKDFIADFYTVTRNTGSNMDEVANDAVQTLQQENWKSELLVRESMENEQSKEEYIDDKREEDVKEETEESRNTVLLSRNDSEYINPDISQILGEMESVEIAPQTQYFLNQVSHDNNITGEIIRIENNSLPELDAKKLISQANKTLSNLLLEGECQNEISEQTDSGICTVISSENTSLYDKSPEEKKTFAGEIQASEDEEIPENRSYSDSSVNSSKQKDSTISENSCVCSGHSTKALKNFSQMASNINGSSEEFVGVAYGNGQITVCDGNQPNLQINYSENWENLNLNMNASTSHKEFWNDLKCKNCPSTSQSVDIIGNRIETTFPQENLTTKRIKGGKHKSRHQRKYDRSGYKVRDDARRPVPYCVPSTESSRSNSMDRYLNPRFTTFGASLHPSQNTRQMPSFGSRSPHASPRLQHFEIRGNSSVAQRTNSLNQRLYRNSSSQSKKLLDHRRSRSEQIARMKRRDSEKREKYDKINSKSKKSNVRSNQDLLNDGLGPRTDKSGIVTDVTCPVTVHNLYYQENRSLENITRQAHMRPMIFGSPMVYSKVQTSSNMEASMGSSSSSSSRCDSSSETSEFQSDCQDDEEIALAMQAAEIANRNQIRAKFRSSEDLVHRLFVCIAGVADQLQTNFASDLRNILKCVFLMNSSQMVEEEDMKSNDVGSHAEPENYFEDQNTSQEDNHRENEETIINERTSPEMERGEECVERAPAWIPDNDAPRCMACQAIFTVIRRRHHCRNCGQVFCGRCSSNNVPLPRYGHTKPVRVCNRCFLYQVTPFTLSQVTPTS